MGSFCCRERLFLDGPFYESIEARFLASSGIFLDHFLLSGFVEGLARFLEPFFGLVHVAGSDRFAGFFDGTLDDTFDYFVALSVGGCDAHVLLGRFLDRHDSRIKI